MFEEEKFSQRLSYVGIRVAILFSVMRYKRYAFSVIRLENVLFPFYKKGRHRALSFVGEGEGIGHAFTIRSKGNLTNHIRRPIQQHNIRSYIHYKARCNHQNTSFTLCERPT